MEGNEDEVEGGGSGNSINGEVKARGHGLNENHRPRSDEICQAANRPGHFLHPFDKDRHTNTPTMTSLDAIAPHL